MLHTNQNLLGLIRKSLRALRHGGLSGFRYETKCFFQNKVFKQVVTEPVVAEIPAEVKPLPPAPEEKKSDICTFERLYNRRFRALQQIPSLSVKQGEKRINLVTDSIAKDSLLGGVSTALLIASRMAIKIDAPLRVITRNVPGNPKDYYTNMGLLGEKTPRNVTFYCDYDRGEDGEKVHKLEVSKDDIFIATSWWSAVAIKKTSIRDSFFYIIQEVETFFYPHGDDHLLCSEILQDKSISFIINSGWLYEYFKKNNPIISEHGYYFEPAFPKHLYKNKEGRTSGKYNLFFYSRPGNPRNLFYHGLKIIDECVLSGIIDTAEWEINLVGSDVPEFTFCNGYKPKMLGQLDWDAYAEFLKSIDLGISLMYTPHPSYPPLDIAASGGVVVTNRCYNKVDIHWSENIIVSDIDEMSMVAAIEEGIVLAKDTEKREKNFQEASIPGTWDENLSSLIDNLCGEI